MSHYLNRSKVSAPAVADNSASRSPAENVERNLIATRQAQLRQPRPRVLKPPLG